MYSLVSFDGPLASVYYETPCGENVRVAGVEFFDGKENGVLITFPEGRVSLSTLGKIYEIVKLELDRRNDS